MRVPANCTALGKAVLAFTTGAELDAPIAHRRLPVLTPNTITDMAELQRSLAEVRQLGYATDAEESLIGSQCIAAPVFDLHGQAIAAVSVSVPTVRMGGPRRSDIVRSVTECAKALSVELGDQEHP